MANSSSDTTVFFQIPTERVAGQVAIIPRGRVLLSLESALGGVEATSRMGAALCAFAHPMSADLTSARAEDYIPFIHPRAFS
jgi:hypothetical protein